MRAAVVALAFASLVACHPGNVRQTSFDGAQTSDKPSLIRHGLRLTRVLGCTGCHGADLEGTFFTKNEPQYGPLYAPNLTISVRDYTDAELDGIIRHGIHPKRKSVWAMPSQIFQNLSDADYGSLVAYLRTLKPQRKKLPQPRFSVQDRADIAAGR